MLIRLKHDVIINVSVNFGLVDEMIKLYGEYCELNIDV